MQAGAGRYAWKQGFPDKPVRSRYNPLLLVFVILEQ